MATFLAIPPVATAGLVVPPSAIAGRLPTALDASTVSTTVAANSTIVALSDAARILSAIGSTADTVTSPLGSAANTDLTPQFPTSSDTVAGEQRATNARLALQALIDDPGLRAIKNQADPLYSALIAASHMSDFVPASAAGINLNAIASEIPAPITPAAASRAIDFYRETASEFQRQLIA